MCHNLNTPMGRVMLSRGPCPPALIAPTVILVKLRLFEKVRHRQAWENSKCLPSTGSFSTHMSHVCDFASTDVPPHPHLRLRSDVVAPLCLERETWGRKTWTFQELCGCQDSLFCHTRWWGDEAFTLRELCLSSSRRRPHRDTHAPCPCHRWSTPEIHGCGKSREELLLPCFLQTGTVKKASRQ